MTNVHHIHTDDHDAWYAWFRQVEIAHGRPIQNAQTIDLLYAAYLGGRSPAEADEAVLGLQHIGIHVGPTLLRLGDDIRTTAEAFGFTGRGARLVFVAFVFALAVGCIVVGVM